MTCATCPGQGIWINLDPEHTRTSYKNDRSTGKNLCAFLWSLLHTNIRNKNGAKKKETRNITLKYKNKQNKQNPENGQQKK
jgi:hypothetical protein